MASTVTQVSNYISSVRVGVADFVDGACLKERLGHTDTFCSRQQVILASAYLDCVVDYFTPFIDAGNNDGSYATNNFFTTDEIRDMMQHLNNICDTFYMIEL
jgi:hypothetical protein